MFQRRAFPNPKDEEKLEEATPEVQTRLAAPALQLIDIPLYPDLQREEMVVESEGLIYVVGASLGAETLTLRATNKAGEQVGRSVVIEKVEFTPLPDESSDSNNNLPLLPPPPPPTLPPASSGQFPVYQFDPETD